MPRTLHFVEVERDLIAAQYTTDFSIVILQSSAERFHRHSTQPLRQRLSGLQLDFSMQLRNSAGQRLGIGHALLIFELGEQLSLFGAFGFHQFRAQLGGLGIQLRAWEQLDPLFRFATRVLSAQFPEGPQHCLALRIG